MMSTSERKLLVGLLNDKTILSFMKRKHATLSECVRMFYNEDGETDFSSTFQLHLENGYYKLTTNQGIRLIRSGQCREIIGHFPNWRYREYEHSSCPKRQLPVWADCTHPQFDEANAFLDEATFSDY